MARKTSTKTHPTPLRDLQITAHVDQARRYLILDGDSPLPSPTYPFDVQPVRAPPSDRPPLCTPSQLPSDSLPPPPRIQVQPRVDALFRSWNDSPNNRDLDQCCRSFTPPISPPRGQDTSKRSGRTFALVPAQAHEKHVFTRLVVGPPDSDFKRDIFPLVSPREDGLPEDMQDILRQLDDLASWVKVASSSRVCNASTIARATRLPGHLGTDACGHSTGNLTDGLLPSKGKNRLLSASPASDSDICRDSVDCSGGAVPGNPSIVSPTTDRQSGGFIYMADRNTPEFLVGSSSSPIAYPVCGYSSHPSRCPRHPSETTHDIPHHHRFLEYRSAPCHTPVIPLVSPPAGKASFKTLFQRSRCNTTAVTHTSIPPNHVPVESALRRGKRIRLPWLRI